MRPSFDAFTSRSRSNWLSRRSRSESPSVSTSWGRRVSVAIRCACAADAPLRRNSAAHHCFSALRFRIIAPARTAPTSLYAPGASAIVQALTNPRQHQCLQVIEGDNKKEGRNSSQADSRDPLPRAVTEGAPLHRLGGLQHELAPVEKRDRYQV